MNRVSLAAGQTASNLLYLALNYYRALVDNGYGEVHRKRLNWMTDLDCSIRNPPPHTAAMAAFAHAFSVSYVCTRGWMHVNHGIIAVSDNRIYFLLLCRWKIFNWSQILFVVSDLWPENAIFPMLEPHGHLHYTNFRSTWNNQSRDHL